MLQSTHIWSSCQTFEQNLLLRNITQFLITTFFMSFPICLQGKPGIAVWTWKFFLFGVHFQMRCQIVFLGKYFTANLTLVCFLVYIQMLLQIELTCNFFVKYAGCASLHTSSHDKLNPLLLEMDFYIFCICSPLCPGQCLPAYFDLFLCSPNRKDVCKGHGIVF